MLVLVRCPDCDAELRISIQSTKNKSLRCKGYNYRINHLYLDLQILHKEMTNNNIDLQSDEAIKAWTSILNTIDEIEARKKEET